MSDQQAETVQVEIAGQGHEGTVSVPLILPFSAYHAKRQAKELFVREHDLPSGALQAHIPKEELDRIVSLQRGPTLTPTPGLATA